MPMYYMHTRMRECTLTEAERRQAQTGGGQKGYRGAVEADFDPCVQRDREEETEGGSRAMDD